MESQSCRIRLKRRVLQPQPSLMLPAADHRYASQSHPHSLQQAYSKTSKNSYLDVLVLLYS